MIVLGQAVYAGTPIDFLPLWLVQGWRVLLWAAELSLIGSMVVFLPRAIKCRRAETPVVDDWVIPLYLGVMIYLVMSAVTQIENWGAPLVVEGMPVNTVIVCIFLYSRHLRRLARIR